MKFLNLLGKSPLRTVNSTAPAANALPAIGKPVVHEDADPDFPASLDAQPLPSYRPADPALLLEQRIEEASLLHANGQSQAAADLLNDAVSRPTGATREVLAWRMLLELAIFGKTPSQFDALALRYAERFETSPPQWRAPDCDATGAAGVAPVQLRGSLLAANCHSVLAHLAPEAGPRSEMALELDGLTDIDAPGAAALLALLQRCEAAHRDIVLLPAPRLAARLQERVQSGRRDEDDACWRLLIELLRIGSDERAYEDACLAYSLTYDMSPPVTLKQQPAVPTMQRGFPLPTEILCPTEALLASLRAHAASCSRVILDCRALRRIEFAAAAPLLDGIARLAQGKPVEWRDIPVIVSMLLQLVGGRDCLKTNQPAP